MFFDDPQRDAMMIGLLCVIAAETSWLSRLNVRRASMPSPNIDIAPRRA